MNESILKILILGILIIVILGVLLLHRKPSTEGFQDVSSGLPQDADNPNLKDDMIFGSIPQAASASIFKKAEIRSQTANPDAINIDDSTGAAMVTQSDFDMTPEPDDIQSQLDALPATEGFQDNNNAASSQLQGNAQDKIQNLIQNNIKQQAKKSKGATQAKKVALKQLKKSSQKLGAKFQNKVGGKLIKKVMEKVAAKLGKKIGEKAAVAGVKAGLFSTNPVTAAFGVTLGVIAAIGAVLQIAIVTTLKGEEGVCETGYQRLGSVFPSWLSDIPGIGDIMGSLAPYLCYRHGCDQGEDEEVGFCYPACDAGYGGVGPLCWTKPVNIGIGILHDCPPGWSNDGLTCRAPLVTTLDPCPPGSHDVIGTCWGVNENCVWGCGGDCGTWKCCGCSWKSRVDVIKRQLHERNMKTTGGEVIGRMDNSLKCPGDHPDSIDGLCYRKCPTFGGAPYTKQEKVYAFYKKPVTAKQDAASQVLTAYRASKGAKPEEIQRLSEALNNAMLEDARTPLPSNSPYVFNPEYLVVSGVKDPGPLPPQAGPEPEKMTKLGGFFLMQNPAWLAWSEKSRIYNEWVFFNEKWQPFLKNNPVPAPNADPESIPFVNKSITVDPSKPLRHVPGMPYQCMADRGISYGRGVGKIKLNLKIAKPTPPPPPPPPSSSSLSFVDPPYTGLGVDFSNPAILQDMSQFYYAAALANAVTNQDGTLAFSYITKISKVVASSEQSADIICDMTNVVMNPETGSIISSTNVSGQDRRFYFAKLAKQRTFVVTGSTNANSTAPDVKNVDTNPVDVTFTANIQKCVNIAISMNKCTARDTLDAMLKKYTDGTAKTIRVKSIDGAENTASDTCTMAWTEVTYDPSTNIESATTKKVGNFTFTQDKSNDACLYKLQAYAAGDPQKTVKDLKTKVVLTPSVPPEVTLQGCQTTCKDTNLLQKLINAFNTNPANLNRIITVNKAVTPSPLRCDIEANVYVKTSKQTEKQTIRFDLSKDASACVYNVTKIGEAGSGTFVQTNTPTLAASANTADFLLGAQNDIVKAAQAKLNSVKSSVSQFFGVANTGFEKTFADVGQIQSLGSCPKKCTDADVLDSIMSFYNTTNYPSTRNNVTKKTMTRILKVGTASANECDVTFEEKQEVYTDLYADTPNTTLTQKTQRFKMKDTGNCKFAVEVNEGFQNVRPAAAGGLPGMRTPSVVNNASPSLAVPYTGTVCDLDCTKAETLRAVKQKYESSTIEGFFSRSVSFFREAFQDTTTADDGGDGGDDGGDGGDGGGDGGDAEVDTTSADPAPANTTTTAPVTSPSAPAKVVASKTMKKVNRVLRIGPDKCEFEVIYDSVQMDANGNAKETKDGTGYFQATFSKDTVGCSFLPSQVVKANAPVIPGVPAAKVGTLNFTF